MSQVKNPPSDVYKTVEVKGPNGQATVLLEGLRTTSTVLEIKERARAALELHDDVEWKLRDNVTGRLLQDDQKLAEFSDEASPHIQVTMQPDAALG